MKKLKIGMDVKFEINGEVIEGKVIDLVPGVVKIETSKGIREVKLDDIHGIYLCDYLDPVEATL